MKILGAILCGGRSTRFGSDKALALVGGIALIDHVRRCIAPQVDALLFCGREIAGETCAPDRPHADLGPLGGINAALYHALGHGYDAVVSLPCDTPALPPNLVARLARARPAYLEQSPVIGFWPAGLAPLLDRHIEEDPKRSMRGWAQRVQAEAVTLETRIRNVNRPEDLPGS
ncbi:MAG: molybdenum cofactor guanylyltransferase [Sphingobium sp.]